MWSNREYILDETTSNMKGLAQLKDFITKQKLGRVCKVSSLRWRVEQINVKLSQYTIMLDFDRDIIGDIIDSCDKLNNTDIISTELKNKFNEVCDYLVKQVSNIMTQKG